LTNLDDNIKYDEVNWDLIIFETETSILGFG